MRWSEEDLKSYLDRTKKGEGQFNPWRPTGRKKNLQDSNQQNKKNNSNSSRHSESSKYKNKRTKIDGHLFDSQKEADYYLELKIRLKAKDILGFCLQPKFILDNEISYKADFIVFNIDGSTEIIDIKPSKDFQTQVYKLKKKMFQNKYDLRIKEVY